MFWQEVAVTETVAKPRAASPRLKSVDLNSKRDLFEAIVSKVKMKAHLPAFCSMLLDSIITKERNEMKGKTCQKDDGGNFLLAQSAALLLVVPNFPKSILTFCAMQFDGLQVLWQKVG